MNRMAKKRLMVIAIVLTFTLSSVAFVVTGITGNIATQEFKPLQSYVLEGEIDPYVESVYIQNGFTFLKYYYREQVPSYLDALPQSFATNTGEVQLFVVKVKSDEDFISISNLNGAREIKDITQENIFRALCETLVVVPVECSLLLLQNQTNTTT